MATYPISGDEIYVDARILKWHALANLLGLSTAYELDRVELVRGGKAEQVRERVPLENARIDVDLVPGDRVGRHAPVGKAQRGRELLRGIRTHRDARGELLARE